ncbi:MAG TPA: CvpA family protein [Puia sp.]|nr:CvpA family protein [Puia sp.]
MLIDILFLLIMLMAVFSGLRRGLILAVFSGLGFVVGLAAAIKLSATVAAWLKDSMNVSVRWLPVLAFAGVFVLVVLLVRWGGRLLEAAIDLAMMGWINKLGGVLLYAALYSIVLSVLLFYAVQVKIIPVHTISSSVTYPFIRPWGPVVIDGFARVLPFFKGMFTQLEDFFGRLSGGKQ